MKHIQKIRLFYCILGISFFSLPATVYLSHGMTIQQAKILIAEKNKEHLIEFAFDIHKTLLEKDVRELKAIGFNGTRKWAVIANIFNYPLMAEAGFCGWQYALMSLGVYPSKVALEEIYAERFMVIFEDTKAAELASLIGRLVNAQRVKPGMFDIVRDLKKIGYTLRIASNIGKHVYEHLKVKLTAQGNNIFALFDKDEHGMEGKVVDYANGPVAKPDPQYYFEYLTHYNPNGTKLILLVDDKKKNIREAIKHGMIGFHFTTADALRKDLKEVGLLP